MGLFSTNSFTLCFFVSVTVIYIPEYAKRGQEAYRDRGGPVGLDLVVVEIVQPRRPVLHRGDDLIDAGFDRPEGAHPAGGRVDGEVGRVPVQVVIHLAVDTDVRVGCFQFQEF